MLHVKNWRQLFWLTKTQRDQHDQPTCCLSPNPVQPRVLLPSKSPQSIFLERRASWLGEPADGY